MTKIEEAARQWLGKAERDLLNARNTLSTMGDDCPYDTVCFHAQQAAEKCIKAVLTRLQTEFPKSHDIGELVLLLPKTARPAISVQEQRELTSYAVAARYPAMGEDPSRKDAAAALGTAEEIKRWAVKKLAGRVRK